MIIVRGFLYGVEQKREETYLETTGVIIGFVRSGSKGEQVHTYVEYDINGVKYPGELKSYSSSFFVGSEIAIKYNPENPMDVYAKELGFLLPLVFLFIGVVFLGIGIFGRRIADKSTINKVEG